MAFLFLSYFDYVMLTYERYQALHTIHIRVPGEPGNEAMAKRYKLLCRVEHGALTLTDILLFLFL